MRPTLHPPSTAASLPAGRILVGRKTLLAGAVAAALAAAWGGAATWYIVNRDEVALRFFAQQAEIRFAYEDRIAALQGRLEREVTRNLVERDGFEKRAVALARRQGDLEERQRWLRGLAERTGAARPAAGSEPGSPDLLPVVTAPPPPVAATRPAAPDGKPVPLPDGFGLRLGEQAEPAPASGRASPKPADRLSVLEGRLLDLEGQEVRVAEALRSEAAEKLGRLRSAIEITGLGPGRLVGPSAQGGPLVPLPDGAVSPLLAALADEITFRTAELDRLRGIARTLPLARPLAGEAEQTSSFGYRLDPFTRGAALHTGIDFRAETGTPVRAAAAGTVVAAEYASGYGNMVEIDHGRGVTTRYGHLSALGVTPGMRVGMGEVVGRAGSTGRSTGPHLHYETRIDGEPVNPVRFLEAGRALAASDL